MVTQFAICLNWLWCYGNSFSAANIADWTSVSVGNVELSIKQCILAILSPHEGIVRPANLNEEEA